MIQFDRPLQQIKCGDNLYQTLNNTGYMFENLTAYGKEFIEFCSTVDSPVLDIGAAYGVATLPALEKGAYVIANDIDHNHLVLLKSRVPETYHQNLELRGGKFPTEIDFPENSLSAILIANVWHFLSGEEMIQAIELMYSWLKPGGKVFIITATPYAKVIKDFILIFHERKIQGEQWPGEIEDISIYNHPRLADLPKFMHFMDDEVIHGLFCNSSFLIEKVEFIARPDLPLEMQLDGRETVGIIVVKPH